MTDRLQTPAPEALEVREGGWELIDDAECRRVSGALELIGRKWSSGILLAVARGADRFSQIRSQVIGLSDRLLAARLHELERADLIERAVEPTTPVTIRYRLTPRGDDLMASLQGLVEYEQRWPEHKRNH